VRCGRNSLAPCAPSRSKTAQRAPRGAPALRCLGHDNGGVVAAACAPDLPSTSHLRLCGCRQVFVASEKPPAEIPDMRTDKNGWYQYWDEDNDGTLNREEVVRALLKTLKLTSDQGRVRQMRETIGAVWPIFDTDGSGTIDRDEFLRCQPSPAGTIPPESASAACLLPCPSCCTILVPVPPRCFTVPTPAAVLQHAYACLALSPCVPQASARVSGACS
jgi:hypothetical protein